MNGELFDHVMRMNGIQVSDVKARSEKILNILKENKMWGQKDKKETAVTAMAIVRLGELSIRAFMDGILLTTLKGLTNKKEGHS